MYVSHTPSKHVDNKLKKIDIIKYSSQLNLFNIFYYQICFYTSNLFRFNTI